MARTDTGRFAPGASGNPAGRPAGKFALEQALDTALPAALRTLAKAAREGDTAAAVEILRASGRGRYGSEEQLFNWFGMMLDRITTRLSAIETRLTRGNTP